MNRFSILLSMSPDSGTAPARAVDTLEAALSKGYAVFVFLYEDGILFARKDRDTPQGEIDLVTRFTSLSAHPNCDAVACITAGERRGLRASSLLTSVRFGGLGEWTESLSSSDIVVQFR
ncbi:DsrE family protein [Litorivicinus sp.]|nr:DsrE family protein [Litorivicinus sp.]MDC1207877.1 DsrE family protein [Litorivicinus sp.]MDC1240813.1 DsrE family protein [Litorivicinus sp.]